MMKMLRSLKASKSGASAAEYALILAVMGGFVIAATLAFGGSLKTAMTNSGTQLTSAQSGFALSLDLNRENDDEDFFATSRPASPALRRPSTR